MSRMNRTGHRSYLNAAEEIRLFLRVYSIRLELSFQQININGLMMPIAYREGQNRKG